MEAAARFALRRLLPHCRRQPPSSSSSFSLFSTSSHRHPPSSSSFSLFTSIGSSASVPARLGLFKNLCPKIVEAVSSSSPVPRFKSLLLCWNASGRKLLYGSVFGFTMISAGMISDHPTVVYADDYCADHEEPSAYLGDELHTFWTLSRKFQLPIVLLTMVLFGWRHPITLAVNVAMLLFCTRHGPLSVYLFIEQLRQRDMKQGPGLHKSKLLLYTKKVEVEDCRLLCLSKVQLRDAELHLVGVLGSWWVYYTTRLQNKDVFRTKLSWSSSVCEHSDMFFIIYIF